MHSGTIYKLKKGVAYGRSQREKKKNKIMAQKKT